MAARRSLHIVITVSLLANAFATPLRLRRDMEDNEIGSSETKATGTTSIDRADVPSKVDLSALNPNSASDDDDDEDFEPLQPSQTGGGGSNIFSLLNLATALFPAGSGSSGGNNQGQERPSNPLWALKLDILRAVFQFATSLIGSASSGSSNFNG